MNKPDWKDAPEWADRIIKSGGEFFFSNKTFFTGRSRAILLHGGVASYDCNGAADDWYVKCLDSDLVETRPDPWAEGEERMKVIPQNGNEGEHYDELPELDEFLGEKAESIDQVMSVEGYDCLRDVLVRAYDQAAKGKGDERHAQGAAFEDQPMQKTIDLYGVGFALGQSAKKAQESMRLPKDRAIAELLGGINYLAGAIINMEKSD
jgi:hypothetical protein